MFSDQSRYAKTPRDTVKSADGRDVAALRLRRLPPTQGTSQEVHDGDRLDLMAQRQFGDSTRFWHIADANTRLEANQLVARVLGIVKVPGS